MRDRLCQIIRQHRLDPNLVKSYATNFCSVKALRDATREQVENFVAHLSDWAEKDRNALLYRSTATSTRKEVPLETPNHRTARRRSLCSDQIPDGVFLVRVQRVRVSAAGAEAALHPGSGRFEPNRFSGGRPSSRLYCTPKALWKLNWFLRDFGYDTDLLGRDEVDETQLLGLKGVVKISHIVFNGAFLLRLDGFAPAGHWEELSPANLDNPQVA